MCVYVNTVTGIADCGTPVISCICMWLCPLLCLRTSQTPTTSIMSALVPSSDPHRQSQHQELHTEIQYLARAVSKWNWLTMKRHREDRQTDGNQTQREDVKPETEQSIITQTPVQSLMDVTLNSQQGGHYCGVCVSLCEQRSDGKRSWWCCGSDLHKAETTNEYFTRVIWKHTKWVRVMQTNI